jgi:hypothetical protein
MGYMREFSCSSLHSALLTWFWEENDQKDFQSDIDALLRSLILEHEKKLGRKAHEKAQAEAMRMNERGGGWSISSDVDLVMFEIILHGQGNVNQGIAELTHARQASKL